MKVYNLTAAQIVDIYQSGIERGNDESSAYEWGCAPRTEKHDYLRYCLIYDIKLCGDIEYEQKDQWFEDFINESKSY